MWVYFDASALVKRYSAENGTEIVNEIFRQVSIEHITCAMIGVLEIVSVLVRKQNDGRISSSLFEQAMLELNAEILENPDFELASINDDLLLESVALIAEHNINATDAIILRSCLNLQRSLKNTNNALVFCSCDKRLLRAAQHEGLSVVDPEIDTVARLQKLFNGSDKTAK